MPDENPTTDPTIVPTIVVVDDAAEVRLLLRTRLRVTGALDVVGEGADGAEAVLLAEQHQPSLMLLDVSMPGTDGLTALPRVLAASPRTRVVLYTGFEERGLAEKALELGAAAFVEKSVGTEELVERLLALMPPTAEKSTSAPPTPALPPLGFDARVDHGVLSEHLERFREVFDEAAIGMATMTLAGNLVRVNRALAALVEGSAEGLVGTYYGDLMAGGSAQLAAALEDIDSGPVDVLHFEHAVVGAAVARQVRVTLAPVRDSAGRPLYLFVQVQDVTAERAAIEELRRSEERFRLLVETVEDYAIFMLDPTGHVVSWNAGAERAKGYSAQDIIGRHFRVFYPREVQESGHPEHELEVALREGHYEEEGWRLRKDGSRFWANVLITAVFDPSGRHVGFAKVTRDMSERRALEQRLERAVDEQAQFLAVTAHELRTPIGVLGGSAETLAKHWADLTEDERSELLDAMVSSTARLRRLLADLLTASRLQASALDIHLAEVDVAEVVAQTVAGMNRSRPGTEVRADVDPGVTVLADADRLAQILDNLVGNAVRHGTPPVTLSARHDGADVELRVSDHGSGVPQTMQEKLFERFATRRGGGGTGLGLYIVRQLAETQGGTAYYEPQSAEHPSGAFVVRLPAAPRPER